MIYIFGHKKPDTDSVTSAIALSYLKNKLGLKAEPRILGKINEETKFVLDHFNVEVPKILQDVKLQIKDINYFKDCYAYNTDSLYKVYEYMIDCNVTGVPIVSIDKKFIGLITSKMIMNNMIKGSFDKLDALYNNIVELLKGESIIKFDINIKGKIDKNIFIVRSIEEFRNCMVNKPKLIIITNGFKINYDDYEFIKENKINVIRSNFSEFKVDKLITLANSCGNLKDKLRKNYFYEDNYYEYFKEEAAKIAHNNYPVLSSKGKCLGLIRVTDMEPPKKKRVILVDHNEAKQSVEGLEEAEILEIIDHHKIKANTINPINFRNMTVGSTNTIIYSMFMENNVDIPKDIAGLMLSGIISDTLLLTSPTTTEYDKYVADELSKIADINIESYGKDMFKAGTNLKGKSIDEVIDMDAKEYEINDKKIYISNVITLNPDQIFLHKGNYVHKLTEIEENREIDVVVLLVTDMIKGGSYIFFNHKSKDIVSKATNIEKIKQGEYLEGILSRKKQLLPMLMDVIR